MRCPSNGRLKVVVNREVNEEVKLAVTAIGL